jgi:hypothetical protein
MWDNWTTSPRGELYVQNKARIHLVTQRGGIEELYTELLQLSAVINKFRENYENKFLVVYWI